MLVYLAKLSIFHKYRLDLHQSIKKSITDMYRFRALKKSEVVEAAYDIYQEHRFDYECEALI